MQPAWSCPTKSAMMCCVTLPIFATEHTCAHICNKSVCSASPLMYSVDNRRGPSLLPCPTACTNILSTDLYTHRHTRPHKFQRSKPPLHHFAAGRGRDKTMQRSTTQNNERAQMQTLLFNKAASIVPFVQNSCGISASAHSVGSFTFDKNVTIRE